MDGEVRGWLGSEGGEGKGWDGMMEWMVTGEMGKERNGGWMIKEGVREMDGRRKRNE